LGDSFVQGLNREVNEVKPSMIRNDNDLAQIAEEAGNRLQEIQSHLGTKNNPRGRVKFPRGFFRRKGPILADLPQTKNPRHRHLNDCISHALMTADLFRWLLIRTDLKGLAQKMVIKETICLLGNVCESITKDYLYGNGSSKSYKQRTEELVELTIIGEKLKENLDWLWDQRNDEHLWMVDESELKKYTARDYVRAHQACKELIEAVKARPD